MSRSTKMKHSMARRKEKDLRKSANRAKYEAVRGTAANQKHGTGLSTTASARKHEVSFCGNVGCKRCFPEFNARVISFNR